MCERAARIIGLDICGIDLILVDIAEPLREGNGIVEINAAPGLRMHLTPGKGNSGDVGSADTERNGRISGGEHPGRNRRLPSLWSKLRAHRGGPQEFPLRSSQ